METKNGFWSVELYCEIFWNEEHMPALAERQWTIFYFVERWILNEKKYDSKNYIIHYYNSNADDLYS